MAAITKLYLNQLPSWQRNGTDQAVQRAVWHCEVDSVIPAGYVMGLAQATAAPLTVGVPVPVRGDALAVDDGDVIAGLRPNHLLKGKARADAFAIAIANWVAAGSDRYADGGALAFDEACVPMAEGPTKNFEISMTFRPPLPGRRESPRFIQNFNTGLAASLPTPPVPTDGLIENLTPTEIIAALNPENQPVEFHVEYVTQEVDVSQVRYVFDDPASNVNTLGSRQVFINPNGEVYPPFRDIERIQVITAERIIPPDGGFANGLNQVYRNAINSDRVLFALTNTTYPPHFCKWGGAEESRTRNENGVEYKILTYRVLTANRPFYDFTPATGSFYLGPGPSGPGLPGNPEWVRLGLPDDDGFRVVDEYPLQENGSLATSVENQLVHVTTKYDAKPFGGILTE